MRAIKQTTVTIAYWTLRCHGIAVASYRLGPAGESIDRTSSHSGTAHDCAAWPSNTDRFVYEIFASSLAPDAE